MIVTPIAGVNSIIATGGTSVVAVAANPNGGYIKNPLLSTDQAVTAEVLYVDPVGTAAILKANTTTISLQPGEIWNVIPGQTTPTFVNAATSGHKFTVVSY
jgi:hypothetical protein